MGESDRQGKQKEAGVHGTCIHALIHLLVAGLSILTDVARWRRLCSNEEGKNHFETKELC